MRMKAVLTVFLLVMILSGCGYKIALKDADSAFTLYPADIVNVSKEIMPEQLFVNAVKSYLASIHSLGTKENSDLTGRFTLTEVTSSGAVTLTSGRTVTVDLAVIMSIQVSDKSGKIIYNRNLYASSTYNISSSSPTSTRNRDIAIEEAVQTAMDTFRYEFENRK
ncbi:MAG: LPS assembly lipoprotein LptE [Deferribacterales bacterium]